MLEAIRRYRLGILWIIITTVTVAVLDWPIDLFDGWLSQHGLISDIIAGVLLVFVGFYFIEAWFSERQARKWEEVINIASKEVGYETFLLIRGMDHLISGRFSDLHGLSILDEYDEDVQRILNGHGLVTSSRPSVTAHLQVLLENKDWVRLAVDLLDVLKHHHRRHIAQWVGVMLTTDLMTDYVNQASQINQTIFQIQDMLRIILKPEDARLARPEIQLIAKDPDQLNEAIISHWQTVNLKAKKLQQELMQAAGEDQWLSPHISPDKDDARANDINL